MVLSAKTSLVTVLTSWCDVAADLGDEAGCHWATATEASVSASCNFCTRALVGNLLRSAKNVDLFGVLRVCRSSKLVQNIFVKPAQVRIHQLN